MNDPLVQQQEQIIFMKQKGGQSDPCTSTPYFFVPAV